MTRKPMRWRNGFWTEHNNRRALPVGKEIDIMQHRREFLRHVGEGGVFVALLSAGLLTIPQTWAAENSRAAFDAKTVEDAFRALGATAPALSDAIELTAPTIAENGAVVPIKVASAIPGTQSIALLVEENPYALAMVTTIPEGTEAYVSSRVKMQKTSRVIALVRAGDEFFMATRDVKVTLGGCGG